MKIQPVDVGVPVPVPVRPEPAKQVLKFRLKRLFDRQFPKISSVGEPHYGNGTGGELEPSSVCLDKMVENYIEDTSDKLHPQPLRSRNRCNCFNANNNHGSDDEFDVFEDGDFVGNGSSGDSFDVLKSLILCASVSERNLLADTALIVEKNKHYKRKEDLRKIVSDGLCTLGYDSSICKSKWDKTTTHLAGEYEYVDVIIEGERLLIDIDFRSEFEIARSTGTYKNVLQTLPYIFVGKPDRIGQIVTIVLEAAKQSLKKKGMHFPPWRKAEYMRAKWLSPFTRLNNTNNINDNKLIPPRLSHRRTTVV
ncbi:hypothetical protein K2173_013166 [Erythroxylum novogranatense]|uniref:Uncharacterized protein n=1 Tax=Erythroxylum novogranatense TaxID=1862640 RepID=A0AAV8THF6_9ROSI|nr:hypothetical protein K2173_013166 [Erythroxylum novogranatense]